MIITGQFLIDEFDKRDIPLNKRVLTYWRVKTYLPRLQAKGCGRGKGKSYFWSDAKVIERALLVDEALNSGYRGPRVLMILWLFGYDISSTSIRDHLITGLTKVARLTRGKSLDPDAIEDHIDDLGSKYDQIYSKQPELNLRWDMPPGVMEMILNVFANPAYDLDDTPFEDSVRDSIKPECDKTSGNSAKSIVSEAELLQTAELMWRFVGEHISLDDMQAALAQVTDQKLREVQKDINTLFGFVGQLLSGKPEMETLREWRVQAAYSMGMLLTVIDLTLRHQGWGYFIDAQLSRLRLNMTSLDEKSVA
jgi:hypothetical protein